MDHNLGSTEATENTNIPENEAGKTEVNSTSNHKATGSTISALLRNTMTTADVGKIIPHDGTEGNKFVSLSSLLGAHEMDNVLPGHTVSVFIGTWNMNSKEPPKPLHEFVQPNGGHQIYDIVTIGTQENYCDRFKWEVKLQKNLGPKYVLLHSVDMRQLHLAVFVRRELIWFCSEPEDDSLDVRPLTAFHTKGAVAISFNLFKTSYLFITSHLTASDVKVDERISEIKRIVRSLEFPKKISNKNHEDITQNFDCVFWCGDLNFRLNDPRPTVMKWINSNPIQVNLKSDQLKELMAKGTSCLSAFKEGEIKFAPTYKFDPGTQTYDSSHKQRTPSYTDRILFRYYSPHNQIECKAYSSVMSIDTSDHKPLWGVYTTRVLPGFKTVPMGAVHFNKDVYEEGTKKRVTEIKKQSVLFQ